VSNILLQTARQGEEKLITAAAMMGRVSAVEVLSKIKTNLEWSHHPEATFSMRKVVALGQYCGKYAGYKFTLMLTGARAIALTRIRTTRYWSSCHVHGAWVLGKSIDIYDHYCCLYKKGKTYQHTWKVIKFLVKF
jgi:hypothetical protein